MPETAEAPSTAVARKAFEDWVTSSGAWNAAAARTSTGGYRLLQTQMQWQSWLAGWGMSKKGAEHAYGPRCGCHMEPVNDSTDPCDLCSEATEANNGVGWKIARCPLHEAADDMADALEMLHARIQFQRGPEARRLAAQAEAALCKAGRLFWQNTY